MAAPLAAPELVMYDDFLIEAYCSIAFVPFATVSEQRGSGQKTAEHERQDELYGRCRICCSSSRSSEPMVLCDSCDRAFHQECLHPRLKELPKGEWHCPKCTSEALYNLHTRAASVSHIRNVMQHITTFPSLPHKMRLKELDFFAAPQKRTVAPKARIAAPPTAPTTPAPSPRPLKSLPPKMRCKRRRTAAPPAVKPVSSPTAEIDAVEPDAPPVNAAPPATPAHSVVRLARELQPVAQLLRNGHALHALSVLETHFSSAQSAERDVGTVSKSQHDAPSAEPQHVLNSNGNSRRSAAPQIPSKLVVTQDADTAVAVAVTLPPPNCIGVRPQKVKIVTQQTPPANARPPPPSKDDAVQPRSPKVNGITP